MLRKKSERIEEVKTAMREGPGQVVLKPIANREEMLNKARMFSTITLNPGCGIGKHGHEGETEIFLVSKGEADYIDDGREYKIKEGDVTVCPPGHCHGVTNNSNEVCELVALIVLE